MRALLILSLLFVAAHSASFSRQVSASNSSVPIFSRVELSFDLGTSYSNPYDPSKISVNAYFSLAGVNGTSNLPCFYGSFGGKGKWLCRYSPSKVGDYSVTVKATDSAGTASSSTQFTAVASKNLGFIYKSRVDNLHFERSHDGSTYWPLGENMAWGTGSNYLGSYFDWMPKLKQNGCNYIRVWMNLNDFSQENRGSVGDYGSAQGSDTNVDKLVALAESLGFGILWCFNQHPTFSTKVNANWNNSPYNSKNGGPLGKPEDVWTNARGKELFKNRYRYTIARWGYSSAVFAWELWNEQDWIDNYSSHAGEAAQWAKEMYNYFKSTDPFQHIVTTSFALNQNRDEIDRTLDYIQYHSYADGGDRLSIPDFAGWLTTAIPAMTNKYNKPCMVGEFGASYKGPNVSPFQDNAGWTLHNEAWGSLVTGSGGSGFTWWWDNWVSPRNLYYRFKGIGMFMQGQNLGGMYPKSLSASDGNLRALSLTGNDASLVWVQSKKHTWSILKDNGGQLYLQGATVTVPCTSSLSYDVQVWDTVDGYVKSTSSFTCNGNNQKLGLPNFDNNRGDWAFKVYPHGKSNQTLTVAPTYNTRQPTQQPTTASPQPTSGGKGEWEFCSSSSECANHCCSKKFSGDGKYKCTPNTNECLVDQKKGEWEYCSSSAECTNGCCSKAYSGDGQYKCTPGTNKCI